MGVLQFDGTDDRLNWATLAAAITDALTDDFTMAVLLKRDSINAASRGIAYGWIPATAVVNGMSFQGSGGGANAHKVFMDIAAGNVIFPSTFNTTTDTIMLALSKATGSATPRLGWKLEPGGSWTHENGDAARDIGNLTQFVIGAWGDAEFIAAHIGLVGVWDGAMSDGDKEALDNNWRTSDWWNSAHGQPVFLAELNVAGASVVDLAGNASSLTATGTTLDAGETLDSWNFDGVGGVGGGDPIPPHRMGRGAGW